MNEVEQQFAAEIYAAFQTFTEDTARSRHAKDFRLGISDIGYCPERNRRLMAHQEPDETDKMAAFIGSAIGDHAERALAAKWPDAIIQAEVHLDLRVQGKPYSLVGHPDILVPGWGVWDGKTDYGLNEVTALGPSFAQLWQRNAYALAAWQEGKLGDMALEDVQTGNFWIDRRAVDKRVEVDVRPFDQEVIDLGMEEIDSTVYALLNNEEAEKRPPREVCKVTCGFWRICREWETDVHGLLDDPRVVFNIESYVDGHRLEKQGSEMKDQAKEHLRGIEGSTGEHSLRWLWVNPTEKRAGYYRIDISEVSKR